MSALVLFGGGFETFAFGGILGFLLCLYLMRDAK